MSSIQKIENFFYHFLGEGGVRPQSDKNPFFWSLPLSIYFFSLKNSLHFLFNEPFTKRLLALQSIGQRKGGSKTIKKMQKVPKISSALHLSKRRTKDQKTKLSYSHWLQWWPYLSWSNRISLIKLIWLIQLLHNEFMSVKKIDWWIQ